MLLKSAEAMTLQFNLMFTVDKRLNCKCIYIC
jgi:hypothetical protein